MRRWGTIKTISALCSVTILVWLFLVIALSSFYLRGNSPPEPYNMAPAFLLDQNSGSLGTGNMASFFDHWIQAIDLGSGINNNLLHIHQVCVEGGKNGLIIPHYGALMQRIKDIRPGYQPGGQVPVAFRMLAFEEGVGLFGTDHDLWRFNKTRITPKRVSGPTLFVNCWDRPRDDTNPSHWLMKVNKLYEMAEVTMEFTFSGQDAPLPKFSNLAFHQCPSYEGVVNGKAWPWGKFIFDVATKRWSDVGLWVGKNATNVVELHAGDDGWTCFDDIVLDLQYGSWTPGLRYRSSWTRALQVGALKAPNPDRLSESLAHRCGKKQLAIHIFQRKTGSTLRSFQNLKEVQTLLKDYTSTPIKMVSFDMDTSVEEQAQEFQAFDILVTSHGSHLANIVFSRPETSSVVEVAPVVRDACFRNNAIEANFSSYIISTGHRPVAIQGDVDSRDYCRTGENLVAKHCKIENGLWVCPAPWRSKFTSCDTFVDIKILQKHIEETIFALCSPALDKNEQSIKIL